MLRPSDEAAGGWEKKRRRGVDSQEKKERIMPDNSGAGKGKNNMRDPTLRDHEREKGVSGGAIQGEKKVASTPDRQSARSHGQE
jgi:hypothetical protein